MRVYNTNTTQIKDMSNSNSNTANLLFLSLTLIYGPCVLAKWLIIAALKVSYKISETGLCLIGLPFYWVYLAYKSEEKNEAA